MGVMRSAPGDNIIANIRNIIGSQVAVGKYILQISIHGGLVNFPLAGQRPKTQPRPLPVDWRTAPAPDLLDRQPEVSQATAALRSGQPVEVYGQAGIGKTALLDYLAHHYPTAPCPDGVVPLRARRKSADDLLQSLFSAFYESDSLLKPNDIQLRRFLQDKKALVVLDDVNLERDEVEALFKEAPGCTFLLASSERHLWNKGQALALSGLPMDYAVALVERKLGRSLTSQEQPAARDLCLSLAQHPWSLIQAATLIKEEGYALTEVPTEALTARILALRSEPERRTLAALAALVAGFFDLVGSGGLSVDLLLLSRRLLQGFLGRPAFLHCGRAPQELPGGTLLPAHPSERPPLLSLSGSGVSGFPRLRRLEGAVV